MNAGVVALAASLFGAAVAAAGDAGSAAAVLAARDEPGERLFVTGTVYAADGRTPVAGVALYAYHTDARGLYTATGMDSRNPRLKARVVTGKDGRYSLDTIRPASYPGRPVPAHIHYVVTAPGGKDQHLEVVFEGDPFVDAAVRARQAPNGFYLVRPLVRSGAGWKVTADIVLREP